MSSLFLNGLSIFPVNIDQFFAIIRLGNQFFRYNLDFVSVI